MSENITHFSSMEDCFHLMEVSSDICDTFKEAGKRYYRLARLASVTRYGDKFTVPLMSKLREHNRKGIFDQQQQKTLVYVLGWLCHRAADRCMKPVFSSFDSDTMRHAEAIDYSPSECSVYNDAFIYNLYYAYETDGLYPQAVFEEHAESIPGLDTVNVSGVRQLAQRMMCHSLLEMHKLECENNDFDDWLDQIEKRRQRFTLEIERYAEAIFSPHPDKKAKYIDDADFYHPNEPILRLAVQLRSDRTAVSREFLEDVMSTSPVSSYAHILHTGYRYLKAANDYFTSDMSDAELEVRFDIGKLGRDGKPA